MKRFLLAAIGLVALGIAPVVAADLSAGTYTKAPSIIPAIYDWSGLYMGLNGGWANDRRCFDQLTPVVGSDGCHDMSGGFVGGQMGYRWQMSSWVFGVEAQGDWADLHGSSNSLLNPGIVGRSRIDAFGLFTGQVGYAWNTTLLYFKGGAAVAADRSDLLANGVIFATSPNDTRWGGTVGGGVEFSFAPNWSAAVEYDHLFLGNNSPVFTNSVTGGVFSTDRVHGDADMVSVRVNYRWGGPVIGKY